ncbi:MAG TPA: hypothetical protein VML19_20400, partial [Verrucomicrobiae bacterium]|nr:hypothetical protein [Verrucomicrobiae bacterium]
MRIILAESIFTLLFFSAAFGQVSTTQQAPIPLGSSQSREAGGAARQRTPSRGSLRQSITFEPIPSQVVGTVLPLTATASSGLTVSFASLTPTVCKVSGTTASLSAAGTCTILAGQDGNSRYAAARPVSQSFAVLATPGKAPQTITFGPIAAQSVTTTLALSASASSGLPVTFESETAQVCTVSGATASMTATGTCAIQATQAGNGVYAAATPVRQSFAVNAKPQAITFNGIAPQTAGTVLALSATASSGLPVSFASLAAAVCSVNGSTASLKAPGTCTIQASQAGNSTYAAATPVSQSFTVNAAPLTPQTITFNNPGTQIAGTPLTLTASASSSLPVSFASTTTSICTVSGATATFVAAGTCTIQASQAGNSTYAAATPVSQSF